MSADRVGPYEVLRRLPGDGEEVYLAREGARERILSVLDLDEARAAELTQEVARCDQLRHRAIVPVFDVFEHEGRQVVVFERIAGVSLLEVGRHVHEQDQRLPASALAYVGHELASCLAVAHAAEPPIVHAAMDPQHAVVSWQGEIRLVGLGIGAALAPPEASRFAAPETQAGTAPGPSSNTRAVAAVIWWLATGKPPDAPPQPPLLEVRDDLPAELASALERALAPEPQRVDCRELARLLEPHARGGEAELRWHLEIYRALVDLEVDAPPSSEAFASARDPAQPEAAVDAPVPSSDASPTRVREVPAALRPGATPADRIRDGKKRSTLRSKRDEILAPVPQLPGDDDESMSARGRARPSGEALPVVLVDAEAPAETTPAVKPPPESPAELPPPSEPATIERRFEPLPMPDGDPASEPVTQLRAVVDLGREHASLAGNVAAAEISDAPPPSGAPPRASHDPLSATIAPPPRLTLQRVAAIVLVSVVAAFGAGVLVARRWLAPAPPAAPQTPELDGAGTPVPEPVPAASTTAGESAAAASASASPAPGHSHLIAVSTVKDAGVYVFGDYRGRPNEPLEVRCNRMVFVRLGTVPPRHWYTPGRSLFVRCGEVTRVSLEPAASATKTAKPALPDDL